MIYIHIIRTKNGQHSVRLQVGTITCKESGRTNGHAVTGNIIHGYYRAACQTPDYYNLKED